MADGGENYRDGDSDWDEDAVEYSGMVQPPLIKQLKTILAEYPDDGQILKEIIQNAEDAEASELKILYDGRHVNNEDINNKKRRYRKYFKGPALVMYNNAEFTEADWEGITMLYSSIKELDRTKVGRFGLGFKSVFHITDYPMIISGDKLLILDPHQRDSGKVCQTIPLKKLHRCRGLNVSDCMNSLSGIFGFSQATLDSGRYGGTLFHFPLRDVESDLSDNIYDESKVTDLVRSFETEAPVSLLFLKSLEKIELFIKNSTQLSMPPDEEPKFLVKVAGQNSKEVRDKRKSFLEQMKTLGNQIADDTIAFSYEITIVTTHYEGDSFHNQEKMWLLYNLFKGGNMSEQLKVLSTDESLGYSPYVGIAFPLCQDPSFKGHVFCFLPLPLETKSLTGLPVHVNGCFALGQNRRHIKWATADQVSNRCHRDKSIQWNECLISEVVSEVYHSVINYLIRKSKQAGNQENLVAMVTKCIPDMSEVDDKWKMLIKPVYERILKQSFLYTTNSGGQWIGCSEAVFSKLKKSSPEQSSICLNADVEETVLMLVRQYNQNLVEVPPHLWNMIQTYGPSSVQCITPSYIRSLLKSSPIYRNFTSEEKIHILQFVLEDGIYGDLNGLKLLPLHNGKFQCFKNQLKKIYSCDVTEIEMFPGVEDRFLKTDLPETVQTHLQCVVSKGLFQIVKMQKADIIDLLNQTIIINFGDSPPLRFCWKSQPTSREIWLSRVWNYIRAFWPNSLLELQRIPVLPIERENGYNLYDLTGSFILKTCRGFTDLPDAVCTCLKHLSVIVIPSLPSYVLDHLALMDEYVFYPSVEGVLSVLGKMSGNRKLIKVISIFHKNIGLSERKSLLQYLGNAQHIPEAATGVLCQLKLFHNTSGKELVSVNKLQSIAPDDSFPVAFPEPMIHCRNKKERHMALLLGAEEMSKARVIQNIIEHLSCGSVYSDEDKQRFMKFFGQNIESVKGNHTTMKCAREIRFIPTCCGTIKKAIDLFNPKEQVLSDLFPDGQVFPKETFRSDLNLLNLMCHLGLKSINDITASDVLDSVKCLDKKCRRLILKKEDIKTSKAIIKIFKDKPNILNQQTVEGRTLKSALNDLLFIKPKPQPSTYPKILKWYKSPYALCSSSEVIVSDHCQLVGSVKPLLPDGFPSLVVEELGCNKEPSMEEVIQQLMHIIAKYQDQFKPELLPLLKSVYLFLSERIDNCDCLRDIACVWTGDGFKKPEEVYLNSRGNDVNLHPYMYQLPSEFQTSSQIKSLFRKMGSPDYQESQKLLDVQEVIRQTVCGKRTKKDNVRRNLDIIVKILHRFHDEEVKSDRILFPVQKNCDNMLELRPAKECHYCNSNWLEDSTKEEGEEIYYVHERVSTEIARNLGVPSLTDTLLSGTEAFGPTVLLTSRIRDLLQNSYTDGFSVPKELVQNADDAGASKVCFLYDERENEDAREKLIHPNMSECQGPALWAYNNALFTDEDLHNIRRINDSKKKEDSSTVGKFGLGFCSVYNLTDVPSFVSGENIVIFDPIGKYLGDSHGRKISLGSGKNLRLVRKMKDQFTPFNGVFGCNLNVLDKEVNYKGTLFRLPLRTASQAMKNVLVGDDKSYTKSEMQCLLKMFMEAAGNILLFTQSVAEIELYHLPSNAKDPSKSDLIYRVGRTIKYTEDMSRFNTEFAFMTGHRIQVLKYMSSQLEKLEISSKDSVKENLHLSAKMDIEVEVKKGAEGLCRIENVLKEKTSWIIAWESGVNEGLTKTSRDKKFSGLLPLAGTAVMIDVEGNITKPRFLEDAPFGFYKTAHYFCCLPLPVESGLPIHVNASFAVTSDRRNLCVKTTDDKELSNEDWNVMLMSGGVCNAYILILETLKQFGIKPEENLYDIWPVCTVDSSIETVLQNSFYNRIVWEDHALFPCRQIYASYENCCFLDVSFQNSNIYQIAFDTAIRFYENKNRIVINLPERIMSCIRQVGGEEKLNKKMITPQFFYQEIFFPNILSEYWKDKTESRDALVLFALDLVDEGINDLIKSHKCIPVEPVGNLKMPSELIHPWGKLSSLFGTRDERFIKENEETFLAYSRLETLKGLGAMVNTLPKMLLYECAISIQKLSSECQQCACERSTNILKYLQTVEQNKELLPDETWIKLRDIPFLPVLEKPEKWPFPWRGSEIDSKNRTTFSNTIGCFEETELLQTANVCTCSMNHKPKQVVFKNPTELFYPHCKNLVGCTRYILGESEYSIQSSVLSKLGVQGSMTSSIPMQAVVDQLILLNKTDTGSSLELLTNVCCNIYKFFEMRMSESQDEKEGLFLRNQLKDEPIILIDNVFVKPEQVAVSLDIDCSPYLYGIRSYGLKQCRRFLELVDIKQHFSVENILKVLLHIQTALHVHSVLEKEKLNIILKVIKYLSVRIKEESMDRNTFLLLGGNKLLVPDENCCLKCINDVCMNDSESCKKSTKVSYLHEEISLADATALGIETKRAKKLEEHQRKIPFGPKEEITTRIKRLLKGYPCDEGIMKELLQNADDSNAKELHIIKDFRNHGLNGNNEKWEFKVFDDKWKLLQGPALCVYNDTDFTPEDIAGIQLVGVGTKDKDPTKTGQFGVGFNSVYHLTDTPSFLTRGPNVETGETLCIFDPHCCYVTGATKEDPGMQYIDIPDLRQSDPDVFACYPESLLKDKGTIFRFPLRDSDIAKTSKLSSEITESKVAELLEEFKEQMFEVLLFTNSVQKITISDISTGVLTEEYSVTLSISDEDKRKRQDFANKIKDMSRMLSEEKQIKQLPEDIVKYTVTVDDSEQRTQSWLIVQKLGFKQTRSVPDIIIQAYEKEELGLLPRGGIAMPLPSKEMMKQKIPLKYYKAYCFLPLPVITGLPVNINGHFALDHEARRNLWQEEHEGLRSTWNKHVMQDVIAPAYVLSIQEFKEILGLIQNTEMEKKDVLAASEVYHSIFPNLEKTQDNWKYLASAVLKEVIDSEEDVFLSFEEKQNNDNEEKEKYGKASSQLKKFNIKCFPLLSREHKFEAVFNNLKKEQKFTREKSEILASLLKSFGMKLLDSPLWLYESMKGAEINVHTVSPEYVVRFLKSYNDDVIDKCNICEVNKPVNETSLTSLRNVLDTFQYCKGSETLSENLEGLPLCLTNDLVLRVFCNDHPVYCTQHCHILPNSSCFFVHQELVPLIPQVMTENISIFKPFTIKDLADLLPFTISVEKYRTKNVRVSWNPTQKQIPNKTWVNHLWKFLEIVLSAKIKEFEGQKMAFSSKIKEFEKQNMELSAKIKEFEKQKMEFSADIKIFEEQKMELSVKIKELEEHKPSQAISVKELILKSLRDLDHWCFLPCTVPRQSDTEGKLPEDDMHLAQDLGENLSENCFKQFQNVLLPVQNFREILLKGGFMGNLKGVIEKLCQPNLDPFLPGYSILSSHILARHGKPQLVLECLYLHADEIANMNDLSNDDCNSVLEYFADNMAVIKENLDRDVIVKYIRSLPLHVTVHDSHISLTNPWDIIIIPQGMPAEGMEEWADKSHNILLKQNEKLKCIHEMLHLNESNILNIYTCNIYPEFHNLPKSAWMYHLKYTRDELLRRRFTFEFNDEQQCLIEVLQNLAFIESEDGKVSKASEFFSPHNAVMSVMCCINDFPPKPFSGLMWEEFMKLAGMKTEVTEERFIRFATKLEQDGILHGSTVDIALKSAVLVEHLFGLKDVQDRFLQKVSTIRFIAPYNISKYFYEIHTPYNERMLICFSNSVLPKHNELVWTTLSILPEYADPSSYRLNYGKSQNMKWGMQQLNVKEEPPLNSVLGHLQNVADSLEQFYSEKSFECDEDLVNEHKKLMSSIYEFVQYNGLKQRETKWRLQQKPIVFLPKYKKLVTCDKAVVMLNDEDKLEPYLYPAPDDFGPYFRLFETLGMCRNPTSNSYAKVLEYLYQDTAADGDQLHPNELEIVKVAIQWLFEMLPWEKEEARKVLKVNTLYLPNKDGKLCDSRQLVFSDNRYLKTKMRNETGINYFAGFKKLQLQFPSGICYIKALPECFQPKILSEMISETLVESSLEVVVDSSKAHMLQAFVHSEEFVRGMIRLVADEKLKTKTRINSKRMVKVKEEEIIENLKNINIAEVVNLQFNLMFQNKVIGEECVPCYFVETGYEQQKEWHFYFTCVDNKNWILEINRKFTELLECCTNTLFESNKLVVFMLLHSCLEHPGNISELLDKNNVKEYKVSNEYDDTFFPAPGTPVHQKMHHLLINSFTSFSPREHVAIQVYDYEDGDETTEEDKIIDSEYIYARIVEKIECNGGPEGVDDILQKYKVNVGIGCFEDIPAYKIFKFHRKPKSRSKELKVVDRALPSNILPGHLTDTCREINKLLKTVWTLQPDEKRLIIKRLLRQWHPDKNVENEEFATEVFHYISVAITRLENGEDLDDEANSECRSNAQHRWSQQVVITVKRDGKYQQDPKSDRYSHSTVSEPRPMPGIARRWYKQAGFDLEAAKEFHKSADRVKGYNWVCYKCHQSAEKALKSVWYYRDASNPLVRSHELCNIANDLEDELRELAGSMDRLLGTHGHTRMRYPDMHCNPETPADAYTVIEAEKALEIAEKIYDSVHGVLWS